MPEKPKKGRALLSELHNEERGPLGGNHSAQSRHYIKTTSMTGVGWRIDPTACKQLRYIGCVEKVALVAELAIDLNGAVVFDH